MRVFKCVCVVLAAAAVLASSSCVKFEQPATTYTEAVMPTETETEALTEPTAAQTEKNLISDQIANAYLKVIERYMGKYGQCVSTPEDYFERINEPQVLWTDLFDWNLDGTPELLVHHIEKDTLRGPGEYAVYDRYDALDVFFFNGKKAQLLTKLFPRTGEESDESEYISFAMLDGKLVIKTQDVRHEGEENNNSFYTYDSDRVIRTQLESVNVFDTVDGESVPVGHDKCTVDGESVRQDEYDAQMKKYDTYWYKASMPYIFNEYYERQQSLIMFLKGEMQSYDSIVFTPRVFARQDITTLNDGNYMSTFYR